MSKQEKIQIVKKRQLILYEKILTKAKRLLDKEYQKYFTWVMFLYMG